MYIHIYKYIYQYISVCVFLANIYPVADIPTS